MMYLSERHGQKVKEMMMRTLKMRFLCINSFRILAVNRDVNIVAKS